MTACVLFQQTFANAAKAFARNLASTLVCCSPSVARTRKHSNLFSPSSPALPGLGLGLGRGPGAGPGTARGHGRGPGPAATRRAAAAARRRSRGAAARPPSGRVAESPGERAPSVGRRCMARALPLMSPSVHRAPRDGARTRGRGTPADIADGGEEVEI